MTSRLSRITSHKRTVWTSVGLVLVSVTAALSLSAWAAGGPPDYPPGGPEAGAMQEPGRCPGMGGPMMGERDAEGMPFAGHHLKHLLDEAKASEAQRAQIYQISEKAQADIRALHEEGHSLHEEALAFWAKPKLDAAEAENLRQRMDAHHEVMSKRITQALLDVGNVLTPAQRATVAESMRRHEQGMMARMKDRIKAHVGGASNPAQANPEGK